MSPLRRHSLFLEHISYAILHWPLSVLRSLFNPAIKFPVELLAKQSNDSKTPIWERLLEKLSETRTERDTVPLALLFLLELRKSWVANVGAGAPKSGGREREVPDAVWLSVVIKTSHEVLGPDCQSNALLAASLAINLDVMTKAESALDPMYKGEAWLNKKELEV
jgi:hypothetical protein